jgi:hypothetical protein
MYRYGDLDGGLVWSLWYWWLKKEDDGSFRLRFESFAIWRMAVEVLAKKVGLEVMWRMKTLGSFANAL